MEKEEAIAISGSFIVEGSNFSTIGFKPGARTCLVEITTDKLNELKAEMEGS